MWFFMISFVIEAFFIKIQSNMSEMEKKKTKKNL